MIGPLPGGRRSNAGGLSIPFFVTGMPCNITTTYPMISSPCGWTAGWSIRRRISPIRGKTWIPRRSGSWSTSAGNCVFTAASGCSTSDADGGGWSPTPRKPATWRPSALRSAGRRRNWPGSASATRGSRIAPRASDTPRRGPSFVDRYVFPDGDLVPISTTLRVAEKCGFEVRDVESLREHYVLTLRHWIRRLEAGYGKARQATDEMTCRIWRLYMSGAAYWFRTGRNNVYQALLVKSEGGRSGMPLTRAEWYS